ncbi:helix-turn-helix domain-containing protein [Streptomyces sp. Ru73]|uniref:helix-turn-helix domain-containing protein n=1 Tax=Streptomyces sp. Ru73 TaxID=2080748 RepID=UPI0015E31DA2|nr:helix-turn-helix domain-containing protein [Streptomyces sp. Ru73]
MAPQPVIPAEEKARLVLDLLAKRTTLSQAAQHIGVSPQAVANWRRQFVTAGQDGLRPVARRTEDSRRERQLLSEIALLKAALGEAHLALRSHRIRDLDRRATAPRAHLRTPDL